MTTDIERQFFDTFGIEPKNIFKGCSLGAKFYSEICKEPCKGCKNEIRETIYSQISDRILLELICLISKELNCFTNYALTYEHMKEYILKEMILEKDKFTESQVQALFKEDIYQ